MTKCGVAQVWQIIHWVVFLFSEMVVANYQLNNRKDIPTTTTSVMEKQPI